MELLKVNAKKFLELGESRHDARHVFCIENPRMGIPEDEKKILQEELKKQLAICETHDLPVAHSLILARIKSDNLPETEREYDCLIDTIDKELESKLFLFVPSYRARYYENDALLSDVVTSAFASASSEMRSAGNCFAAGQSTACVFHSMRAAEIGIRALGRYLEITLKKPIELSEWAEILNAMNTKIRDIENQPATPERNEKSAFCSQAAAQFRFFKNAWRNDVAHAHAIYNESQAKEALDHVISFFETLATRLSE